MDRSSGFLCGPGLSLRSSSRSLAPRNVCTRRNARMSVQTATHELDGRTITGPLKPANNHVLVRVAEAVETTTGGLILSSGAVEKPTYGEAVEVGPGKFFGTGTKIPMAISKGDTVLYGKYGGTEVTYDGVKHTFVTQDDILCKLAGGKFTADAVEPIFDKVLIKRDDPAAETSLGIIIAAGGSEKTYAGKIVAVGPGRFMENGEMEPVEIKVGDSVLFGQYSGTEVKFDGEDYILVRIADIYAMY